MNEKMSQSQEGTMVLVTGSSGYLGAHVTQQLLQAGYRVRGTVRDLKNSEKVEPLHSLCPYAKYPLELVEADVLKPETWPNAIRGCKYVIHVASPALITKPANEYEEVIKPAIDGTLNVLKACAEVGGVKRVVLTSHLAAIYGCIATTDKDKEYDENDWTDENHPMAYHRSKVQAEKAAWNYLDSLHEKQKFELAVINPAGMFGPILCGGQGASIEFPTNLLKGKDGVLVDVGFDVADVRDVATAHVRAMTTADAAGHRHPISSDVTTFPGLAKLMADEFNPQGYKVPTCVVPPWMISFIGFFCKEIRGIKPMLGSRSNTSTCRMREVLKIEPHSMDDVILDMCYECIEKGYVHKTPKYAGPREIKLKV